MLIHHPPLTDQSRFKHLTDAAAFQAMIRRVGCELVLHGHNHRSEVARIAGPHGPVPVLGVTSASAAPDSKYGRARYHLIHIEREGEGWRLERRGAGAQRRRQRLRARWRPRVPQRRRARHGSLSAMASSDIVVTPVDGKSDLKAFIELPKRPVRRPQGLHRRI